MTKSDELIRKSIIRQNRNGLGSREILENLRRAFLNGRNYSLEVY
jgi:hypothetical protein